MTQNLLNAPRSPNGETPQLPALEATALLNWYDRHRRSMPWRMKPDEKPTPYKVWLSEIMLQQTTVSAVIPYYQKFLEHFPTLSALAEAPLEEVLKCWAGLGYYSRARNLHACAQAVQKLGDFPKTIKELESLPGIGPYTARAVGAIAFGLPVVPVDGNVERVTARLAALTVPLPRARPLLAKLAAGLNATPEAQARPSDFAQALFDLGATICTPRNPACLHCPWRDSCRAHALGIADTLPQREKKKPRPVRYGAAFRVQDKAGHVLLRRRPPEGLLGGMDELPGTPWRETPWETAEALPHAPHTQEQGSLIPLEWEKAGEIKHVFTHFTLMLTVYESTRVTEEAYTENSDTHFRTAEGATVSGVLKKCLSVPAVHASRPFGQGEPS